MTDVGPIIDLAQRAILLQLEAYAGLVKLITDDDTSAASFIVTVVEAVAGNVIVFADADLEVFCRRLGALVRHVRDVKTQQESVALAEEQLRKILGDAL